jgi:hypothetical protein
MDTSPSDARTRSSHPRCGGSVLLSMCPDARPPVVAEDIAPRRPRPCLRPTALRTGGSFSGMRLVMSTRGFSARVRILLGPAARSIHLVVAEGPRVLAPALLPTVPEIHRQDIYVRQIPKYPRPARAAAAPSGVTAESPPPRCGSPDAPLTHRHGHSPSTSSPTPCCPSYWRALSSEREWGVASCPRVDSPPAYTRCSSPPRSHPYPRSTWTENVRAMDSSPKNTRPPSGSCDEQPPPSLRRAAFHAEVRMRGNNG